MMTLSNQKVVKWAAEWVVAKHQRYNYIDFHIPFVQAAPILWNGLFLCKAILQRSTFADRDLGGCAIKGKARVSGGIYRKTEQAMVSQHPVAAKRPMVRAGVTAHRPGNLQMDSKKMRPVCDRAHF